MIKSSPQTKTGGKQSPEDLGLLKQDVFKYIQAQHNMAERKSVCAIHRVGKVSLSNSF